jgi:hypothetical protein
MNRALAVSVMRGVSLLSLVGPGRLGAVELHAADAEHRQYGHGDHDDADAAQPLQQLAVEQDRFGQIVEARQHRGAGGGEAGDGLEDRVGGIDVQGLGQGKGQGAEQAREHSRTAP